MEFYDAAIVAKAAEQVMAGLRESMRDIARDVDRRIPPEPERTAGERLLQQVRPVVVKADAVPTNVRFYEATVAANGLRRFFSDALRRVAEAASAAGA